MRAVVTLCFLMCILGSLRRRPDSIMHVAFVTAILLPYFAVPGLMGYGTLSTIHPATVLIFGASVIILLARSRSIEKPQAFHSLARRLLLVFVVVMAVLIPFLLGRSTSLSILFNQIFAPILFVLNARRITSIRGCFPRHLITTVLIAAGVEAVFAITQSLSGRVLVFEDFYGAQSFSGGAGTNRYMGTLGHPLALSMLLAAAAPLLVQVRRLWLWAPMAASLLGGAFVAQSRVGLVCVALGISFSVFRQNWTVARRLLVSGGVLVAMVFAFGSTGAAASIDRFSDDNNSSVLRNIALTYWSSHLNFFAIEPRGLGASYRLAANVGLTTSFESAFLMFAVDMSLVGAIAYFLLVSYSWLITPIHSRVRGAFLAGAFALAIPQTYSSLATDSAAGVLLAAFMALNLSASSSAEQPVVLANQTKAVPADSRPDVPPERMKVIR